MICCDAYYISNVLGKITYNDIMLSMGLSNSMFILEYGNNSIPMLKPRCFNTYEELFEKLGIQYQQITVNELFDEKYEKEIGNILLFASKIVFDNIDTLEEGSTQLTFSMSTYSIKNIDHETVLLVGMDNEKEYEKETNRATLEKLSTIHVSPEGEALKIFILRDAECTQHMILENIKYSMQACLYDCYDYDNGNLLYSSGKSSYRKIGEVLTDYDNMDSTKKKILVGSMVSGSNFFYRREYAEIIENEGILPSSEVNGLKTSGGYWRKITRMLINNLIYGHSIDATAITNVVDKIQYLEMEFIQNMIRKLP